MSGKTHVAAGVATTIGLVILTNDIFEYSNIIVVGAAIGSIFPDIDHPKSVFGRLVPIIPKHFKHRGPIHTIWFIMICLALMLGARFLINTIPLEFIVGFIIGMFMHLVADCLTVSMLKPFRIKKGILDFKVGLPLVKTGTIVDTMITVALTAGIVAMLNYSDISSFSFEEIKSLL